MTHRYSMMTVTPQKTQKAFTASSEVAEPTKKAMQSVSDVIVMEGPACIIARLRRSAGAKVKGYWSRALQMTNMSSTPMPSIRTGTMFEKSVSFQL